MTDLRDRQLDESVAVDGGVEKAGQVEQPTPSYIELVQSSQASATEETMEELQSDEYADRIDAEVECATKQAVRILKDLQPLLGCCKLSVRDYLEDALNERKIWCEREKTYIRRIIAIIDSGLGVLNSFNNELKEYSCLQLLEIPIALPPDGTDDYVRSVMGFGNQKILEANEKITATFECAQKLIDDFESLKNAIANLPSREGKGNIRDDVRAEVNRFWVAIVD